MDLRAAKADGELIKRMLRHSGWTFGKGNPVCVPWKENPQYEAEVRAFIARRLAMRGPTPQPRPAKPNGFFAQFSYDMATFLEWVAQTLEPLTPISHPMVEDGCKPNSNISIAPVTPQCAPTLAEPIAIIEQLATISKPGAVMELWSDVEKAFRAYANDQLWRRARLHVYIGRMKRQRLISAQEAKCLQNLQEIRNVAAHDRDAFHLSEQELAQLARTCYAVISRLSSARGRSR
jgi:hypothetical protein